LHSGKILAVQQAFQLAVTCAAEALESPDLS
jgi:hypothetical protein